MIIKIILFTFINIFFIGCFFSLDAPKKDIPAIKLELANLYKKENNSSKEKGTSKEKETSKEKSEEPKKKETPVDKFKKNHNIVDIINIIDNG